MRPLSTRPQPNPTVPPDADAGTRRLRGSEKQVVRFRLQQAYWPHRPTPKCFRPPSPVPGHAGPPRPASRWATVPELRPPAAGRPATVSRAGRGRTAAVPRHAACGGPARAQGHPVRIGRRPCLQRGGLCPNSHGGARPPRKVSFGGVKGERRVSPSVAGSCGPRGISPPRSGAVSRARPRYTDLPVPASATNLPVPASATNRMPGPATPSAGGRGLATASTALPSCQRWWCGGAEPETTPALDRALPDAWRTR